MDKRFKRINLEEVKRIVHENGFYYLPLERVYDFFCGCKYIIVTENIGFKDQHPEYKDEIVMTVKEFMPYAEAINMFLNNEDKERKRQLLLCAVNYDENELLICDQEQNPVEETVTKRAENKQLYEAMRCLTETQRKRIVMYFFCGYTYEKIAKLENVDKMAVFRSIESGLKKIKKFF